MRHRSIDPRGLVYLKPYKFKFMAGHIKIKYLKTIDKENTLKTIRKSNSLPIEEFFKNVNNKRIFNKEMRWHSI